mgnify:CR=1 FL=1
MNNTFFEENYSLAKKNFEKKNYKEAEERLLKCLDLKDSFSVLNLLGIVYIELKEYKNAVKIFKKLIYSNFVNDSVHNNLGIALKNVKNYVSAIEQFKLSLKFNPQNYLSFFNLGNIFSELNQDIKAEKSFISCLKINEAYTPALLNLSALYLNKKELKKSKKLLEKCIQLKDQNLLVLENLAKIHLLNKNFAQAEIYIKKIIKISPTSLNKIIPVAIGYVYQGKSGPYKNVCKFYNSQLKTHKSPKKFNYNKSSKPFKLGFIGPDFRNHPIGFFLKDMLPELNKKVNVNIFSTIDYADEISEFAKKNCKWIQCDKLTDELLAELIYRKKIDVLVDTSGMTRTNKLNVFKLKPAKTQISWAGWLASTNMKEIDYIVGDNFATPLKDDKNFSEKVYRIKDIWCTYSRSVFSDLGLKKKINNSNEVIFGCFQRPEKINNQVLKAWSKILVKVKNCKIYFINNSFDIYEKKKITDILKKNKVNLSKVFFISPTNRNIYLNYFNLVDVNLDTFPYNGGTTSFESSFMNTPTLTMKNNSCMFRCGESINKNSNMDDWIANNEQEYVDKAVFFSNKKLLKNIKKRFNSQNEHSVLFDSKKFSNEFVKMISEII